MRMKSLLCSFVVFLLPVLAIAQETPTISIEEIQICTSVQDRQPVGEDTSFARDIGQLYCFTKLSSSYDTASISHVWYYNDKEMLRVELDVRAKKWRTWSTKRIIDTWIGEWRVDVLSSDGNILASKQFTIQE